MSSGFKENFQRDGGEDEGMDYDDSAFYYFGMAMLGVVLIPMTYNWFLKPIFFGEIQINYDNKNCECKMCQKRLKDRAAKYAYVWFDKWFAMKTIALVIGWVWLYQCGQVLNTIEPMKTFIPHDLLGVDAKAEIKDVKRAYRKLSREKHPDKNPDNPNAVQEFIQITKAYTIMTDPKARDNFLKYGNPDGKGSMSVGIALPNFLKKSEYQIQVLLVFFVTVIFVIPGYFFNQISMGEMDVGGVNVENRKIFSALINENMLGKHIPSILSYTVEFSQMKVRNKEEFELLKRIKLNKDVKDAIPKQSADKPPLQVKSICILMAHMYDLLSDEERSQTDIGKDLDQILRAIPSYMDIMLSQTMALAQAFKQGQQPKRITAKNIMTLIQFSQNLMQGGWINKDAYQQLPGFDEQHAKKLKGKCGGKTLYQYCMLKREERQPLHEFAFAGNPDQKDLFEEQEKCIQALPLVKLTMSAFVEGEDEIVVGDILTCKLEVEYFNLDKGERSGYVCSKHYPYLKRDNWFLIITDESFTGLAAIEKLQVTDNKYVKEFKERIQRPGKIAFTSILTNDSYKGLDQFSKVEINVVAKATNRVTYEYSKEDIKAIKEQNMLTQALQMEEEETDDDEDLDEDTELKLKMRAAGLLKERRMAAERAQNGAAVSEEDELDDQD